VSLSNFFDSDNVQVWLNIELVHIHKGVAVPVMDSSDLAQHTVGRHGRLAALPVRLERREIIYCKRAILSLSSSKILNPHPPLRLASVSSPQQRRGYTLAGRRGGWGVNNLEDERNRIALLQ
jgi:hypothetical protein